MDEPDGALNRKLKELSLLGHIVCAALDNEVGKIGFARGQIQPVRFDAAQFSLKKDPFSGEDSLEGVWNNGSGQRLGTILFHADGSFYAEYDVVHPHPTDKRWFVEAVVAWGRGKVLKSEPRLLPALS
jgi:hypothetical protein